MNNRIVINIPRTAWLVREFFPREWGVVKCKIKKFDYADNEIQSVVLSSANYANHWYPKRRFGDYVFIGDDAETKARARAKELNEGMLARNQKKECFALFKVNPFK